MAETKVTGSEIAPIYHQSGWGYTTNPGGSATANVAVTFPVSFTVAPKVIPGLLGYKTGGAPTSVADFTGVYSGTIADIFIVSITTIGFTCYINGSASFGASYNGFTWIAEV
jgi:hypothetical protein